ncbi:hypothetical protein Tco_0129218 [Tanacetum coccineum]
MERMPLTASSLEAKARHCADFQQIVDFLNTGHIKFGLTENPTIYTSLIQQFWKTASTSTLEDREVEITATIDGQLKTITEASLSRHLKLEDADGISSLPNSEIFEQLALMTYASDSDKLTFQKGHFSPQWRFLIHTILHCLSPKKTAWEQFSSNIAAAIICLTTNRTFNFSKMIFEGMIKNLYSRSKFLMYPSMLVQGPIQQGEGSTVPVESHHIPITTPSTLQPPLSSPSRVPTPPHDSPLPGVASLEKDLKQTKKVYSNAYTKLIMRVKKLEHKVKSRQPRRSARVVISNTEEDLEDPSKQGRRIAEIDQNPSISLLVRDLGSGKKGEREISTANISVSNVSVTLEVSTAVENLVYIRRSAEKRKEKGKAIMKEDEYKLEDDAEKKELRDSMDVVPRDGIAIDVESLATN